MPTYRYVCPEGHATLEWRSIHAETVREIPCPDCSRIAPLHLASPAIAADALPNKMHGVRATNATEKSWDRDMPAYKRLRREGLQPRGIDGAADMETRADHPLEIEMGRKLGRESDVTRAQEVSAELGCNDIAATGAEIGAALREGREVAA